MKSRLEANYEKKNLESLTILKKWYVYKQKQQQILHIEIKSSTVMNEDYLQHPDFVKLCKTLKDELDRLICLNCPDDTFVIGNLIGGKWLILCSQGIRERLTLWI